MSERTEEIIAHKCREHGCDPKDTKRHARLYLDEHWDPSSRSRVHRMDAPAPPQNEPCHRLEHLL